MSHVSEEEKIFDDRFNQKKEADNTKYNSKN